MRGMNLGVQAPSPSPFLPSPRNSVRLVIRKVQFAPETPGPQPTAETTRHFLMSDRSLHLEASLDKEVGLRVGSEGHRLGWGIQGAVSVE